MWVDEDNQYHERHPDELLAIRYQNLPPHAKCFYCGHPTNKPSKRRKGRDTRGPRMATKDHVFPRCLGGNAIVLSCLKCNNAKADMTLDEYREFCFGDSTTKFYGEKRLADIEAVMNPARVERPHAIGCIGPGGRHSSAGANGANACLWEWGCDCWCHEWENEPPETASAQ